MGMEAEEFYKAAIQPGFPDEMAFHITHGNPDSSKTFSHEGITDVMSYIHDFVLARIMGRWDLIGKAPKKLDIIVKLEWDGMPAEERMIPWFSGEMDDIEGLLRVDGQHRIPPP